MQRIVLGCAAFVILASPAGAQSNPLAQPASTAQQPAPEAPPPYVPPAPPPPRVRENPYSHHHAAPRHSTEHKQRSAHRERATRHKATHKDHNAHEHGAAHKAHKSTHKERTAPHASKRDIRKCHGMTYRQIVRSSTCRSLMSRDLDAAEGRHHKPSRRHGSEHHKGSDRRHSSERHHISTHHHASDRHKRR